MRNEVSRIFPRVVATAVKLAARMARRAKPAAAHERISKRYVPSAASRRPFRSARAGIGRCTAASVIRHASQRECRAALKLPAAVGWHGDAVSYVDQRLLPFDVRVEQARTVDEIAGAISTLAVRGAPCIGVFAAYGVALLRRTIGDDDAFARAAERVRSARPTAVNLAWAVDRVLAASDMLEEARRIHREQEEVDAAIARHGAALVPHGARVLTHCHTGALATGAGGTALGIITEAQRAGKNPTVFVCETRPLLQGSRLTEVELHEAGVECVLHVDGAAAAVMAREGVDLVLVGADRVVANGDTANKIGTYALAVLASHHGIPFYVAAPRSSFDVAIANGASIPVEERPAREVTALGGAEVARSQARVFNPAFDVTPRHLITAFVTEYGLLRPPFQEGIATLRDRAALPAT